MCNHVEYVGVARLQSLWPCVKFAALIFALVSAETDRPVFAALSFARAAAE
jgi:hypothetical protein